MENTRDILNSCGSTGPAGSMAHGFVGANQKRPPRRCIWRALILACVMATTGCSAHVADAPPDSAAAIRETATGRDIPAALLIAKLARADAVLLGEQHDNAEHHRLQAWVARELAKRGRPVVLAFEMIDESQRPALDRFLAARPRDAASLGAQLGWEQSGWPEWALYQPIADAALRQANAPARAIVPANLPLALARDIARNGLAASGLDAPLGDSLRQAALRDPAVLAAHGEDIRESHCGMLPQSALAPFALAQYARDETMARAIQDARQENPQAIVLLIAGNGHARKDIGVPLHLARLSPGLAVISLGFIEADNLPNDAPFDVAWLTAPPAREDPCEAFRQSVR